ncbi:MAG TPA: hypothetical protein EYP19_03210, partial [Desulfobacterales bacterium]|nr:hypothetical protein [Desulfobacterales bacterium]
MLVKLVIVSVLSCVSGAGLDEFKVKRKNVFDFAESPRARARSGRIEITFTSEAYCDVAVAIEDSDGRIVRHLAAGVLGPNAPLPLQKNTRTQRILRDSKDDIGRYVKVFDGLRARVSLGLQARLERVLFWSPMKRVSRNNRPLIVASPGGVYVFEGEGADHLRIFGHDGQ